MRLMILACISASVSGLVVVFGIGVWPILGPHFTARKIRRHHVIFVNLQQLQGPEPYACKLWRKAIDKLPDVVVHQSWFFHLVPIFKVYEQVDVVLCLVQVFDAPFHPVTA
jgi:hypothetical protein